MGSRDLPPQYSSGQERKGKVWHRGWGRLGPPLEMMEMMMMMMMRVASCCSPQGQDSQIRAWTLVSDSQAQILGAVDKGLLSLGLEASICELGMMRGPSSQVIVWMEWDEKEYPAGPSARHLPRGSCCSFPGRRGPGLTGASRAHQHRAV